MGLRSCHLCGRRRLFPFLFLLLFRVLVLVLFLYRDFDPDLDFAPDRARVKVFLSVRHMARKVRRGIVDSRL